MDDTVGKWHGHTSAEVRYRYAKKVYDNVQIRIPKGQRDRIKQAADQAGMSMAEYICAALTACGCPVSSKLQDDND
jgi:predicted DNA binding CopG/RHH family protein